MKQFKFLTTVSIFLLVFFTACENANIMKEITNSQQADITLESSKCKHIKCINGILHVDNIDVLDSLSTTLADSAKLSYFDEFSSEFKSAACYYDNALNELYEKDNTNDLVNQLNKQYPKCIEIKMLPDSSVHLGYSHHAIRVAWLLNENNQVVIDSAIYTFARNKQTIEYLYEIKEKPDVFVENADIRWVSNNKVEIVFPQLKSLLNPPYMLVRGYKWSGKHRLQAALFLYPEVYYGGARKYDEGRREWYTKQWNILKICFKQDRKMWYGWTKKKTTFSYELKMLYVSNNGGTWNDNWPQNWTDSRYGKEGIMNIFNKERRVYHGNDKYGFDDLPEDQKEMQLTVSVDVKSGAVSTPFNLFYSNLEY